jgi:hypothetical protein
MKKLLNVVVLAGVFTLSSFVNSPIALSPIKKSAVAETNYEKGWKDGHCEGWKEEKGKNAYCPYAPYAPYPSYPKSSNSYRDGYNDGFLRGMSDARKN